MYSISYLRQILTRIGMCRQISVKIQNMKFYGNPSNGVAVLYADGQTKMAKLIVAFRNSYAKSAKIQSIIEL